MTELPANECVTDALYSMDGKQWSYKDGTSKTINWEKNVRVKKIVIGNSVNQDHINVDLPENLYKLYPHLTHLHLWGVMGKRVLGRLPRRLNCLDIRYATKLESISNLPACLETLIIKDCPLVSLTDQHISDFKSLNHLDIAGSTSISEEIVLKLLAKCVDLRSLEAARCTQISMINLWPEQLQSIVLNDCTELRSLPPAWPCQLRRLELSGATSVIAIPDFCDSLDYINLSHTHALSRLPNDIGSPTTLYLHDSGLLAPPASEHGDAHQNVAYETAEFFNDLREVGEGSVKRCKVQMLGNGAAGKTTLSLLVSGQDPNLSDELGSTHGVRFDTTNVNTEIDGFTHPLALQIWDFGGQEIYHGTHRMFMSKGSVFVILWKPDQDGCQPALTDSGYKDEWRPLKYWIDLVRLSCRAPSIAVVCSHSSSRCDAIVQRYQHALGNDGEVLPPLFFVDSKAQLGEFNQFKDWLRKSTTDVVVRQGQVVPAYWEIAQNMVLDWLESIKSGDDLPMVEEQISTEEFSRRLEIALTSASNDSKYPKLAAAVQESRFSLTDNRIRRTLSFLTHSGWLFWSEDLFEERVIVGQEWALNGLYMILERRDHERVYDTLKNNNGVFTRLELDELQWRREGFSEGDQELLLSYMKMCDMCFTLRDREDAWIEQHVYQSIEHLPTAEHARLQAQFDSERPDLSSSSGGVSNDKAHSFHWRQFLAKMGERFGMVASYASDGILIRADKNRLALILFELSDSGIGAEISLEVSGFESQELFQELQSEVESALPNAYYSGVMLTPENNSLTASPQDELTVFVSYAWRNKGWQEGDLDNEQPVLAIKEYFQNYNTQIGENGRRVRLLIDKDSMGSNDSIDHYIRTSSQSPKVIVVHSPKYFMSVNCMYELKLLKDRDDAFTQIVTPVEFHSKVTLQAQRDEYLAYWREGEFELPSRMNWNEQDARDFGIEVVRFCGDRFSDLTGYNVRWNGDGTDALKEIVFRLELTPIQG